MSKAAESWVIRLGWPARGGVAAQTMWYGGRQGAMGPQVVSHRYEAHRFSEFSDAVVVQQTLVSFSFAEQVEIEAW
jgi:hypothetical protein